MTARTVAAPQWRPNGAPLRHLAGSTHPNELAGLYLDQRGRSDDGSVLLRRWRGDWFRWSAAGGYYAPLDDERAAADLRAFLELVDVPGAEGQPGPLRVTRRLVGEVDAALHPATLIDGEAPQWIEGSGPPADELLVAPNGLYHLPLGRLMPATPKFFATAGLGAPIVEEAEEPKAWIEFLHSLWPGDVESIATLQEFIGYTLTPNTRLHKALLIVGPPRSGKGTLARIWAAMLGRDSVAGPTLSSLSERFGLWPLLGKRLAVVSDARLSGRADQAAIVERLLSVTGEDLLTIERKNRVPVTAQLGARFLVLTNELPRLADSSGALASRFVILVLRESFLGREDHDLTDRLLAELPQILRWAIEGWRRLRRRGRFVQPASSAEAVEELGRLGSPIRSFINDECEVGPGGEALADDMFAAWRRWCDREGRDRPGDKQNFAKQLHSCLPEIRVVRLRLLDGSRPRAYRGIRLIGGQR